MRAEQLTDPIAHHGEGPMWDSRLDQLVSVDLLRGDVLFTTADGMLVERRHVGEVAACVVPRRQGGHAVATERGFLLLDDDGGVEELADVWDDPGVRMNDGACDPQGRFYCGSMAYDAAPRRGALYRLDPDRSVHRVLCGVTISNGLGWSPDGATAYFVDSPTQRIDTLVFDGDRLHRRRLVEIAPETGMPDGLTVDADGGIWVALWQGGAVHRYTAEGQLDEVIELPVRQPTSCAFGGDGLGTLFITTSAQDCPEPLAGALFTCEPGVRGLETLAFAG